MRAVAVFGLVATLAVSSLVARSGAANHVCGNSTLHGFKVYAYCGPATATVHYNGRTIDFKGGKCTTKGGTLFEIDIGTLVGHLQIPRMLVPLSFSAMLGSYFERRLRADGSTTIYWLRAPNGAVYFTGQLGRLGPIDGPFYTLKTVHMTLTKGQRAGTFSGRTLGGHPATGTFHC